MSRAVTGPSPSAIRLVARLLLCAVIALACAAGLAGPAGVGAGVALAQDSGAAGGNINYTTWEQDAARAEQALADRRASTLAFEQLRARIVEWRSRFTAAKSANAGRIDTLDQQIAALGPAPAEGATEAAEIARRRKELNDQLAVLKAPGIAAEEALRRAEGIIKQVDTVVRERQADALLKLSPSPLNPVNWPAGYAVLSQGMKTLWAESVQAWENPARRTELRNNFPAIVLYLAIAGLLVIRGPGFMERLTLRLQTSAAMRARDLVAAVVSLGQIIVPVGGVALLVLAVQASGMTGLRSGALIWALPQAALAFFLARWLGTMLFPAMDEVDHGFGLLPENRAEGRFLSSMAGVILAFEALRQAFITEVRPPLSMAAQAVWAAPLTLLMALILFRFGMLLRRHAAQQTATGDSARFLNRTTGFLGTAAVGISLLGPLLAVVGYVAAAEALIWPALRTLGIIGFILVLHRLLVGIYLAVARRDDDGREALVPVLIMGALVLLSLPVLALAWGARSSDLAEIWSGFLEGATIGETTISPGSILTFLLIFLLGFAITRMVQGALKSTVLPRTTLDKGAQNAVSAGIGYLGIAIAAMVAITAAGISLSSFAIVAGALSVGIGFGLQNIVQNFVSGLILLIERPVSEGDMIQVGTQFGIVKGISVRSTRIETFDRTDVIVPNGDLISGVVTNLTRQNLSGRVIVPVGVDYAADTRLVEHMLQEIAEANPLVVVEPAPSVFLVGFGPDSINFEIRAILADVNQKSRVASEINHEIVRRFRDEGVGIPFPQRDVWIRNAAELRDNARGRRRGAGPAGLPDWGNPAGQADVPGEAAPAAVFNDPRDDDDKDRG